MIFWVRLLALIENAKIKETSGGYERLFGIPKLADLISRVQSTVISSGNELEKCISSQVAKIDNLDVFLQQQSMGEGVYLATKKQVKECESFSEAKNHEPDLLIFKKKDNYQSCYVIELKDGHIFDTKKSEAEASRLDTFIEKVGHRIPYTIKGYICCFNQINKEIIRKGLKDKFPLEKIMTGQELCDLLNINYNNIVKTREQNQSRNVTYFLLELIKVQNVKEELEKLLNK